MKGVAAFALVVTVSLALGSCGGDRDDGSDDGAASPPAASPSSAGPSSAGPSSAGPSSAAPTPTTADADLTVVVLGDSIPYNLEADCPGCTGFADSYAEAIGRRLGKTVEVDNQSRHDGARTRDILQQLRSDELVPALADADLVLLSIGFNDQPPYVDQGECGVPEPEGDQDAIDALVATTQRCVQQATSAARPQVRGVLGDVRAQAPEAVIATLVPYNSWTGWPQVASEPAKVRAAVDDVATRGLDAWRDMLCPATEEVGGTCVDVYAAFNGPSGTRPSGKLLSADYTHPSQAGNDRIRDLLLQADLLG